MYKEKPLIIRDQEDDQKGPSSTKKTSDTTMSRLVLYNIDKALKTNPSLNIEKELQKVQNDLRSGKMTLSGLANNKTEERHIPCALLAWQHMGHKRPESLYQFYLTKKIQCEAKCKPTKTEMKLNPTKTEEKSKSASTNRSEGTDQSNDASLWDKDNVAPFYDNTPIVYPMLNCKHPNPTTQQVYMAVDEKCGNSDLRSTGKDIKCKIEQACCLETSCVEKLRTLDKQVTELRRRLAGLAKREADRVEMLERAERAWKDLEMGYMRRIRANTEKEEDIARKSTKLMTDRKKYKETCGTLVKELKTRGEAAEKARQALGILEKQVCELGCCKLALADKLAKETAILNEVQRNSDQQNTDLQFKEEAARRKYDTVKNDLEAMRGMMYEMDRAIKNELTGFKEQLEEVSKVLQEKKDQIEKIQNEISELAKEKQDLTDDLEGCQEKCDSYMQAKVDHLTKKREELQALKDKIVECKCKVPIEVAIQVTRTPSFAAMCYCQPEDTALKKCSCTSLRSHLLSDLCLLLFTGLQSEMPDLAVKMPCQLLKCLEDSFNWDGASVVRTNTRVYFTKLLSSELDIAIYNAIEKYHARWIGNSCADGSKRPIPDLGISAQSWQDRAIAEKAQWMATTMAEELYQQRVYEVIQQAKKVITEGPPPCHCKPPEPKNVETNAPSPCRSKPPNAKKVVTQRQPSCYCQHPGSYTIMQCLVDSPTSAFPATFTQQPFVDAEDTSSKSRESFKSNTNWDNTHNVSKGQKTSKKNILKSTNRNNLRPSSRLLYPKILPNINRRAQIRSIARSTDTATTANAHKIIKPSKSKIQREYAINVCLCEPDKNVVKSPGKGLRNIIQKGELELQKLSSKYSSTQEVDKIRSPGPTDPVLGSEINDMENNLLCNTSNACGSTCACFNKIQDTASIDKLLETLKKWKYDLSEISVLSNCNLRDSKASLKINMSSNVCAATENKPRTLKETLTPIKTYVATSQSEYDFKDVNNLKNNPTQSLSQKNIQYKMSDLRSNRIFVKEIIKPIHRNRSSAQDVFQKKMCNNISQNKTRSHDLAAGKHQNNNNEKYELKDDIKQNIKYDSPQKITKSYETGSNGKNIHDNKEEKESLKKNKFQTENNHFDIIQLSNKTANSFEIKQESVYRASITNQDVLNKSTSPEPKFEDLKNRRFSLTYPFIESNTVLDSHLNSTAEINPDHKLKLIGVTLTNNNVEEFNPTTTDGKVTPTKRKNKLLTEKGDSTSQRIPGQPEETFYQCHANINKNSSNGSIDTFATCICCQEANLSKTESRELEVNVFHLIEEHLQERLTSLNNTCDSTYVKRDLANNLPGMFEKIKQIIDESTKSISCKCSEDVAHGSSWQRAYNLLQEYLKLKIHRAECNCDPSSSAKQEILPELTDKVLRLIEKDFERLKNVYKCNNHKKTIKIKLDHMREVLKSHIPEKDNNKDLSIGQNVSVLNKSPYNYTITSNISAQIKPILETVSCETMKYDHVNEKYDKKNLKSDCFFTERGVTCDFISAVNGIANHSSQYIDVSEKNYDDYKNSPEKLQTRELEGLGHGIEVEKQKQNPNRKINELSSPLLGCTIDCSCDVNEENCKCYKSKVQEHNSVIEQLYQTYARYKPSDNIVSYIMKNLNRNKKEEIDSRSFIIEGKHSSKIKIANETLENPGDLKYLNKDTHTCNFEIITLKDSGLNTNKYPINDGTTTDELTEYNIKNIEESYATNPIVSNQSRHTLAESLNSDQSAQFCDCSKVPICHVKLLISDIENKLLHSKCMCETLSSKVCPIHASRVVDNLSSISACDIVPM